VVFSNKYSNNKQVKKTAEISLKKSMILAEFKGGRIGHKTKTFLQHQLRKKVSYFENVPSWPFFCD
jgi:hypothetical protein